MYAGEDIVQSSAAAACQMRIEWMISSLKFYKTPQTQMVGSITDGAMKETWMLSDMIHQGLRGRPSKHGTI